MRKFWASLLVAVLTILCTAVFFASLYFLTGWIFGDSGQDYGQLRRQAAWVGVMFSIVWYLIFLLYSRFKKKNRDAR